MSHVDFRALLWLELAIVVGGVTIALMQGRAIERFVMLVCVVMNITLIALNPEAWVMALNAKAGCYPWSPASVPYHEGMTLCPGQSTSAPVDINLAPAPTRGDQNI